MEIAEIIVAIAIAIIHPYFFGKATDLILNYDKIMNKCDTYPTYTYSDAKKRDVVEFDYDECRRQNEPEMKKVEIKRHISLMVISLTSVILSMIIQQKTTKVGVGVGGLILLIITLTSYWKNYSENAKVMVTGFALVAVLYASYVVYNNKSITQLF